MISGNKQVKPILIGPDVKPDIEDVFGDKRFKQSIEDIILSLKEEDLYVYAGVEKPKSYLLHGPPGTGKTFATKCIANTLSTRTYNDNKDQPKEYYLNPVTKGDERSLESVPREEFPVCLMNYSIGQMGTAYINQGSVNLQSFFDIGRGMLNATEVKIDHVIYFFDECDALMGKRGGSHSKEDDKLLETLMMNLQEINDRGTNEYVFLATNFLEHLDEASIRAGRIDNKIEFSLPNFECRKHFIKEYINKINKESFTNIFSRNNVNNLAEISEGFNFPDMSQCIDNVIRSKVKYLLRNPKLNLDRNLRCKAKDLEKSFTEYRKQKGGKQRIGF